MYQSTEIEETYRMMGERGFYSGSIADFLEFEHFYAAKVIHILSKMWLCPFPNGNSSRTVDISFTALSERGVIEQRNGLGWLRG